MKSLNKNVYTHKLKKEMFFFFALANKIENKMIGLFDFSAFVCFTYPYFF